MTMINKTLSVFLALGLYSSVAIAADGSGIEAKPYWLQNSYSGTQNGKIGFVGQSKNWTRQGATGHLDSVEDACKDASRQVAEYFSLRVQSSVKSETEVAGAQFFSHFKQSAAMQSDIKLEGIGRSDTYTVENIEENYLQSYCLIELTTQQVAQTKARLQKEQQKIDDLVQLIIKQMGESEFDKAELSIAQLKNLNVKKALIEDLALLLDEQKKKALRVDLSQSKSSFSMGENLSFTVASNQNAYIYVFLEGSKSTKLLFPSPQNGFNLLDSGKPLRYPLQSQIQEGEAFRIPETQADKFQLRLVAATEPQHINFLKTSFTGYYVSQEHSYQQYLADCGLSPVCKVYDYEVNLDKTADRLSVSGYKVKVNGKYSKKYNADVKYALKNNSVSLNKKGKKILVDITVDVAYSKRIQADMYIVSGTLFEIERGNELSQISRTKVTGVHDKNRLPSLIRKLNDKLIKKAL